MVTLFFILLTHLLFGYQEFVLIEDGKGFKNIELDETTFKEVKKILGYPDSIYFIEEYINVNLGGLGYSEKDEWGDILTFSYTLGYSRLGVSLSGKLNEEPVLEDKDYIKSITFKPPFKGVTEKGVILGESNLGDVVNKYGSNLKNIGFSDYSVEYYDEGVIFHFEAKKIDHNSIHYEDYHFLKVVGITVVIPR